MAGSPKCHFLTPPLPTPIFVLICPCLQICFLSLLLDFFFSSFSNCSKILITKFTTVTSFKCTAQEHSAYSHCCATVIIPRISRIFSSSQIETLSPLNTTPRPPPPAPGAPTIYFLTTLGPHISGSKQYFSFCIWLLSVSISSSCSSPLQQVSGFPPLLRLNNLGIIVQTLSRVALATQGGALLAPLLLYPLYTARCWVRAPPPRHCRIQLRIPTPGPQTGVRRTARDDETTSDSYLSLSCSEGFAVTPTVPLSIRIPRRTCSGGPSPTGRLGGQEAWPFSRTFPGAPRRRPPGHRHPR